MSNNNKKQDIEARLKALQVIFNADVFVVLQVTKEGIRLHGCCKAAEDEEESEEGINEDELVQFKRLSNVTKTLRRPMLSKCAYLG